MPGARERSQGGAAGWCGWIVRRGNAQGGTQGGAQGLAAGALGESPRLVDLPLVNLSHHDAPHPLQSHAHAHVTTFSLSADELACSCFDFFHSCSAIELATWVSGSHVLIAVPGSPDTR